MTPPLAALLILAWTLIAVIGLVSYVGLYRLDRRPRRGVGAPREGSSPPSCGAAGLDECTGTAGVHTGPPGQTRAGGPAA